MSLNLEKLKKLHDKAYEASTRNREDAANDLLFYWVTQWDDNLLSESQLGYRGEFDVVRKAGRQILSDLAANPIQIDFEPKDENREDSAEIIDGLYRSDDNINVTQYAYDHAKQEAVICGVGAWELYTDYASYKTNDDKQIIKRMPIFEANNKCFWDPNAKLIDKSDAKYCSVLTAYSEDGYKDLVYELTGEELEKINYDSFKYPEKTFVFSWAVESSRKIYIAKFYHKQKIKEKILIMQDPFGQTMHVTETNLEKVMDELMDTGFQVAGEKEINRYQITRYIASGNEILSTDIIAGECIPIVPCYGERAFVEDSEHYEGCVRLAKDPQRLRNFQLSYLAEVASQSPRRKPIFAPEQIKGFESLYAATGADDNYPYLLQNLRDANGNELPIGPMGVMPEQNVPPALMDSIALSRQAIEDVANPGLPQDIADIDLSGKAVMALQARLDKQSLVYQQHYKYAKRRDAEIYASMASEIYDVPRKVKLTMPDGTKKTAMVMEQVLDDKTGDIVTINDIYNQEFNVYSKIGPDYSSQKEQTIERLSTMINQVDINDPVRKVLQLKQLKLMDGTDFDDIRDYANMQLVIMGIKKPETPEEQQLLQQSQQKNKEPDPALILAQAEMMKGQADIMREQREGLKLKMEIRQKQAENIIDQFDSETKRMKVEVDAQKAGADIDMKDIEALGKQLENAEKMIQLNKMKQVENQEVYAQSMQQ